MSTGTTKTSGGKSKDPKGPAPLDTKVTHWLKKVTGSMAEQANWAEDLKNKDAVIAEVQQDMESVKAFIQQNQQYQAVIKGFFRDKKMMSMAENPDMMKEFDIGHHKLAKDLPPHVLDGLMRAQEKLAAMHQKLAQAAKTKTTTEDGEEGEGEGNVDPLFSDLELSNEFWKPLVREGVIADNAVPDKYNETARVFKASADLYEERCAEIAKERMEHQDILDALGHAKYGVDQCSNIADGVLGLVGLGGTAKATLELAKTVKDGMQIALNAGISIASSVIQRDAEGAISGVAGVLGNVVGNVTGNTDLGKMVEKAYGATVKGVFIGKKLADGDVEGALANLGEGLETSLGLCDNDESKGAFGKIGTGLKNLIKGSSKVKAIKLALESGNSSGAVAILGDLVSGAVEDLGSHKDDLGGFFKDKVTEEDFAALKGVTGQAFDILKDKAAAEEAKKKLAAQEATETDKDLEESTARFSEQLALSMGLGVDADDEAALAAVQDLYSIDKLIAQIEADRKILAMAEALFDASVGVAGNFVPVVGAVKNLKDLGKNIVAAALRAQELNTFMDLAADAQKGSSVYADALRNRVKNAKIAMSKNTVKGILDLAQAIGSIGAASGMGSAAGMGLMYGAKLAQAASDLLYKFHELNDLRRQFKKYVKARNNTYDRINMRKVLRGHPTLSKYALAYGAIEEKDVWAKEGMRKCGLTQEHLEHKDSNAGKVVLYLETQFNEDPKLYKGADKVWKWEAQSPGVLTFVAWAANKKSAEENGALTPANGGAIEGGLVELEKGAETFEALGKKKKEELVAENATFLRGYLANTSRLEKALSSFKPTSTDKKGNEIAHDPMQWYVDTLAEAADTQRQSVRALLKTVPA